jgi:hypothetical protein
LIANGLLAGASIGGAIVVARALPATAALPLIAVSSAFGAIAGGLVGLRRAPSVQDAAAAVDRRLGLQDLSVTALECLRTQDAVSTLVVRAAASRLQSLSPRRLFPLALDASTTKLAAATGAILMLATLRLGDERSAERSGGLLVALPKQATSRPLTARDGLRPAEASNAPTTDRGSQPDRPTADALTPRRPTEASADPSATRGHEPPKTPSANASSADARSGSATERASDGGTIGAAGSRDGTSGSSIGPSSGSGGGTGRGGSTLGRNDSHLAGGITDQNTIAGRDRVIAASIDVHDYRRQYAASVERAEQAVAAGSVPAHLRAYVRDYFTRIRPDQKR